MRKLRLLNLVAAILLAGCYYAPPKTMHATYVQRGQWLEMYENGAWIGAVKNDPKAPQHFKEQW